MGINISKEDWKEDINGKAINVTKEFDKLKDQAQFQFAKLVDWKVRLPISWRLLSQGIVHG